MAAAKGRKLKVFQAQFGFYDSVVAAPSQTAALRAWGTHQNLFADGQAMLVTDEAAINAALAHPGEPLRRAVGSTDPFAVVPTSLPKAPDPPKTSTASNRAKSAAAKAKPPPDRSKLNAAEAAMRKIDAERTQEEAALHQKQEALDEQVAKAQAAYVKAKKAAGGAVEEARKAYRAAGGLD